MPMLYCRDMSMTLITVAIDNEYKTIGIKNRGVPQGDTVNLDTHWGWMKERGP